MVNEQVQLAGFLALGGKDVVERIDGLRGETGKPMVGVDGTVEIPSISQCFYYVVALTVEKTAS